MDAAENPAAGSQAGTPPKPRSTASWTFLAVVVWVFLLRLPAVFWPQEMNVDESQMLSQGMKFLVDPIPWRSVDGTSGGPLNSYLLSFFLLLGFPPGYALLHAVAAVLAGLQVALAHRSLSRLAPGKPVGWCLLPMILVFGVLGNREFLFYSSEMLPTLLLASGFHGFVVWLDPRCERHPAAEARLLFLTGACLGAAPWCKMQALPITGVLGLAVFVTVLNSRRWLGSPLSPRLPGAAFVAGAFAPAALILGPVALAGAFKDFWSSYIRGNLTYAGGFDAARTFDNFCELLSYPELWGFLTMLLIATGLALLDRRRSKTPPSPREWVLLGSSTLFFLAALFAVCRPMGMYPHYATFLLYPLTLLGGASLVKRMGLPASGGWTPSLPLRRAGVGLALAILSVPAGMRLREIRGQEMPPDSNELLAAEVLKLRRERPVRGLTVWGWAPGVHVLTGMPPATRDAIGHFVISPGSMQNYFRQRFMDDLRREMPDVFIDAVARGALIWWDWTENSGYESDPSLKQFVEDQYDLYASVTLTRGHKPARIFVRRGAPAPR
jgi:hypothetical protein